MQLNGGKGTIALTVQESPNGVQIAFDMPGVPQDKIEVVVNDGCLHESGDRTLTVPEGATPIFSNRSSGTFNRSLKLNDSIDPNSGDAVLCNGVLTVTMNQRAELQPKRVPVRSAI